MRSGWRRGAHELWHGQAIEVLSRNTKVGSVCRELREGYTSTTWLLRWLTVTLRHLKWSKVMESYGDVAGKHTKKLVPVIVLSLLLVYREQKHLRPKLDQVHVPREQSWAWLILHQWESHHSNQVRKTEKNKLLTLHLTWSPDVVRRIISNSTLRHTPILFTSTVHVVSVSLVILWLGYSVVQSTIKLSVIND